MAISPDEKLIAFASVKGTVCVLQRAETSTGTRCLNRSVEHDGAAVTALCWVQHSDQVFVGDSQGRLSVINVSLFMVSFFTCIILANPLHWNSVGLLCTLRTILQLLILLVNWHFVIK